MTGIEADAHSNPRGCGMAFGMAGILEDVPLEILFKWMGIRK